MKEIKLGTSPLTNQIYAGYLDKSGTHWKEKQDVTIQALCCVIEHVERFGEPVVISKQDGTPEYEIIVKKLS
ncbi:hypothetical protein A1D22_06035 [Pasteurellaceae bacterium LFhippo2]|nr:hypothetical protein [Pasteurellaceae bacterium LFhippo2]